MTARKIKAAFFAVWSAMLIIATPLAACALFLTPEGLPHWFIQLIRASVFMTVVSFGWMVGQGVRYVADHVYRKHMHDGRPKYATAHEAHAAILQLMIKEVELNGPFDDRNSADWQRREELAQPYLKCLDAIVGLIHQREGVPR